MHKGNLFLEMNIFVYCFFPTSNDVQIFPREFGVESNNREQSLITIQRRFRLVF